MRIKQIGTIAVLTIFYATPAVAQSTKADMKSIQEGGTIQHWERMKELILQRIDRERAAYPEFKICLLAGYPHNEGTYNRLSRREAAGCDATLAKMDKIDRKNAADKARKDAAYDKTHPVKK
jgi:hypothetical protein